MAASVINFLGDVWLVPNASSMFGGGAGAAGATVASQVSVVFTCNSFCRLNRYHHCQQQLHPPLSTSAAVVSGSRNNHPKHEDFSPTARSHYATTYKFLPVVLPVTTTSIGRISGCIAMSHVTSSTQHGHISNHLFNLLLPDSIRRCVESSSPKFRPCRL